MMKSWLSVSEGAKFKLKEDMFTVGFRSKKEGYEYGVMTQKELSENDLIPKIRYRKGTYFKFDMDDGLPGLTEVTYGDEEGNGGIIGVINGIDMDLFEEVF